jgi:NAD(P)H-flavin reductase
LFALLCPLQVADAILANPADKTKVSLLFANVSEANILLKDKIDAMAAAHPDRFKVYYVVDKPRCALRPQLLRLRCNVVG